MQTCFSQPLAKKTKKQKNLMPWLPAVEVSLLSLSQVGFPGLGKRAGAQLPCGWMYLLSHDALYWYSTALRMAHIDLLILRLIKMYFSAQLTGSKAHRISQ